MIAGAGSGGETGSGGASAEEISAGVGLDGWMAGVCEIEVTGAETGWCLAGLWRSKALVLSSSRAAAPDPQRMLLFRGLGLGASVRGLA